MYQKKAEGFEKELVITKQQNKRLKAKVENFRNQLEQSVSLVDVACVFLGWKRLCKYICNAVT